MELKPSKTHHAHRLSMMVTDTSTTQRRANAAIAAQLIMAVASWSLIGWLELHMREKSLIQMNLATHQRRPTNGIRKAFKIISTLRLRTRILRKELCYRSTRFLMISRSSILAQSSTPLISPYSISQIFARRVRHAHGCQLVQLWEGLKTLRSWMMSEWKRWMIFRW